MGGGTATGWIGCHHLKSRPPPPGSQGPFGPAPRSARTEPHGIGEGPRWLERQPATTSIAALQDRLDAFREVYNEHRPHRAIERRTPGEAYRATPKALPSGPASRGHFRLRYDTTDSKGAMTLRRAGRLQRRAPAFWDLTPRDARRIRLAT